MCVLQLKGRLFLWTIFLVCLMTVKKDHSNTCTTYFLWNVWLWLYFVFYIYSLIFCFKNIHTKNNVMPKRIVHLSYGTYRFSLSGPPPCTSYVVSFRTSNSEWNPTLRLWASCWTLVIQKAFIIEQAENERGGQPLMSSNSEVQTLGGIQTFFTFPNTEIKGLHSGFYLINKKCKQNILVLCVFNDP